METLHGVKIGDRFIATHHRKSKRISTVTHFVERKNLQTGQVIGYECWASNQFMGQTLTFETPFTSVLIHKVID